MKYKKGDILIEKDNNIFSKLLRIRNVHKDGTYTLIEHLTNKYYERATEDELDEYFKRS